MTSIAATEGRKLLDQMPTLSDELCKRILALLWPESIARVNQIRKRTSLEAKMKQLCEDHSKRMDERWTQNGAEIARLVADSAVLRAAAPGSAASQPARGADANVGDKRTSDALGEGDVWDDEIDFTAHDPSVDNLPSPVRQLFIYANTYKSMDVGARRSPNTDMIEGALRLIDATAAKVGDTVICMTEQQAAGSPDYYRCTI
jgi:hypothetical protein